MRDKQALTTGEAARYCGVNFRTVIRWIERGHLEAYKLPGRGDNRIPVDSFLSFLQKNEMPVPDELMSEVKHLVLFANQTEDAMALASILRRNSWDVTLATDPMQLGFLIAKEKPKAVLLMNAEHADALSKIARDILKEGADGFKMALIEEQQGQMRDGWHSFHWPVQQNQLLEFLDQDLIANH